MSAQNKPGIPYPSLRRLPLYYRRLRQAIEEDVAHLSSADLAEGAGVSEAQVRKDLSHLTLDGRPGVGYDVKEMAAFLEDYLGLVNDKEAVLVGMGNLGRALAQYPGFEVYGLKIIACFDSDPVKIGRRVGDLEILSIARLQDLAQRLHIQMGIIAVPAPAAQEVAEQMVAGGINVIWNFSPRRLHVPPSVLIKNEDLAAELATLSHYVTQRKIENQFTSTDKKER